MMWRKISAFSRESMPWTRRSILLTLFFTPVILPSNSYLWGVTLSEPPQERPIHYQM